MSQNDEVLRLLKQGPLTPIDALTKVGVFRLAARIHDLRSKGVPIVTHTIEKNDKRFAMYMIERHGTG